MAAMNHGARSALRSHAGNGMFLLSATLMMVGCYIVSCSIDPAVGAVQPLLILIGVLNGYECLLLLLAGVLQRKKRIRPARLLLLIELLFLMDGTFLSAELLAATSGSWVTLSLLLLIAACKLFAWFAIARIQLRSADALFLPGGMLLGHASILVLWIDSQRGTDVDPRIFVAMCYAAGLMLACYGIAWPTVRESAGRRGLHLCIAIAMAASLAGHLIALHWMYDLPTYAAYASPAVLAALPWITRFHRRGLHELAIPIAGILLALHGGRVLQYDEAYWTMTPLRISLLAAAAIWIWLSWYRRRWQYLPAATAAGIAIALGPDAPSMGQQAQSMGRWTIAMLQSRIPRSGLFWGVVSISAAFSFLIAGTLRSLRITRKAIRTGPVR